MAKTKKPDNTWLRDSVIRATRFHFLFIAFYAISIIVFDSWNLITHESVAQRWTLAGGLFVVNTVLWYLSRMRFNGLLPYKIMLIVLIICDIVFAAMNIYWQRGMASKSVALFAVPIITSAILRSRTALLATAALSTAAYTVSAVRYFNLNYGEGYRVELWGELFFYSAVFFVLAWLLWVIINPWQKA
jgi:hypothetical protein